VGISPEAYFVFRFLVFLLWAMAVVWSIVDWLSYAAIGYWFTKLTHIGAIWELLYFGFAAFSTAMAIWSTLPNGAKEATPWFVSVTWFLGANMLVITLTVFVLYWVLVYDGGSVAALTVVTHGGNFALALVDFTWSRRPFNLAHVWVPFVFAIAYAVFTLIYYLAGGTNEDGVSPYIYSAINWAADPSGTGSLLGLLVLVGVPVMHVAFYVIYRICCKPFITSGQSKSSIELGDVETPGPANAQVVGAAHGDP